MFRNFNKKKKNSSSLDRQTRLLHNNDKLLFIVIIYNHYLSKISELKNQVPKLGFQNPRLLARGIVPGKVASKYTAAFLRGCDKWEAIGGWGRDFI
jgi:hypothetical protein